MSKFQFKHSWHLSIKIIRRRRQRRQRVARLMPKLLVAFEIIWYTVIACSAHVLHDLICRLFAFYSISFSWIWTLFDNSELCLFLSRCFVFHTELMMCLFISSVFSLVLYDVLTFVFLFHFNYAHFPLLVRHNTKKKERATENKCFEIKKQWQQKSRAAFKLKH